MPDEGGDEVLSHERDLKDGEGSDDEGHTAKPKVSSDDMLAPSLTQTAKQSCEPQARAAARCMMTRRGYGRESECKQGATGRRVRKNNVQCVY